MKASAAQSGGNQYRPDLAYLVAACIMGGCHMNQVCVQFDTLVNQRVLHRRPLIQFLQSLTI